MERALTSLRVETQLAQDRSSKDRAARYRFIACGEGAALDRALLSDMPLTRSDWQHLALNAAMSQRQ